jgi:hypothetical protein
MRCNLHGEEHDTDGRYVIAYSGARRKWWSDEALEDVLPRLVSQTFQRLLMAFGSSMWISVGDANGVDEAVVVACRASGVCYTRHVALWFAGAMAGHDRNTRVLAPARMLVAISPGRTPGTTNAIKQAEDMGLIIHEWRGKWLR